MLNEKLKTLDREVFDQTRWINRQLLVFDGHKAILVVLSNRDPGVKAVRIIPITIKSEKHKKT